MSHGDGGNKLKQIRAINYLLYFKILYRYVKKYEFTRRIVYIELRNLKRYIKNMNKTYYEYYTKIF